MIMEEVMKIKEIVLGEGTSIETRLYMCPNCKKGHQLEFGINECDICHTKIDWEGIKNEKKSIKKLG